MHKLLVTKKRQQRSLTLLWLLVASVSLASCQSHTASTEEEEEAKLVKVQLVTPIRRDVPQLITAPGIVIALPDHSVKVSPAMSGKIVAVYVVPGQRVKKGMTIAKLDDRNIVDQMAQARATIDGARATVHQYETNLRLAQDNLDRQRKLFEAEVSAKKDILAAQNQVEATKAQLDAAKELVKSDLKAKELVDTQLDFSTVDSPISGVVSNRYLNVGDTVDPNIHIVQIVNLDQVIIEASLPADSPAKIAVGQRGVITSLAHPGIKHYGTVISINPVVDAASNTIKIQLKCSNPQNLLKEGQAVTVSIISDIHRQAILVPTTALVPDNDAPAKSMVYVVRNGKAYRVPVKVGVITDGEAEILSGLTGSETIVATDAYGLPDGTPVEQKTAAEPNDKP